jgi:xanthine dehydrogenase iron-sulfur cluster and FAD-binding subunit A
MTNSHILVPEFEYLQPCSVREALAMLTGYGAEARPLAGGTDLIVQMKMERLAPKYLVDIRKVPELRGISFSSDSVHIGAGSSIWSLRHDPDILAHYPALAEACASFSTTQVQFMGTIGGNLCNGSPASDCAPALIALGGTAIIQGADGQRRLLLEKFFLGPGKTALRTGELLVGVVISRPKPGTGSAFLKLGRVAADLAKVNAAVVLGREGNRIARCRLAFGSVAPKPLRMRKVETLLEGRTFDADLVAEAARVASQEVAPIDDVRSTAWYRREIVRVLAHDGLYKAWEHAGKQTTVAWKGTAGQAKSAPEMGGLAETPTPDSGSPIRNHEIELKVNGMRHRLSVAPNELLLNVLRERLSLTGSKYGCGIGECGACTVQVDGQPMLSCLVLAVAAQGRDILTVEGLQGTDGKLDPLQEAFVEHAGFQCGYCTPGMLMTAKNLLADNPCPSEDAVRDHLKGNLCRCTGYASIVRAVMSCGEPQPHHGSAGDGKDGRD